jgi:hypothetical protein
VIPEEADYKGQERTSEGYKKRKVNVHGMSPALTMILSAFANGQKLFNFKKLIAFFRSSFTLCPAHLTIRFEQVLTGE